MLGQKLERGLYDQLSGLAMRCLVKISLFRAKIGLLYEVADRGDEHDAYIQHPECPTIQSLSGKQAVPSRRDGFHVEKVGAD